MVRIALVAFFLVLSVNGSHTQTPGKRAPKDALQTFNDLIGSWRCTGTPSGTREEQQKNFWTETLNVEWQFRGQDAWLKLDFDKGKRFKAGELRFLPDTNRYRMTLTGLDKQVQTFEGDLSQRTLTLERKFETEMQRLVFTFLHANRFLYRYEAKPPEKTLFARHWQVGATKEGEPFAAGDGKPECIVSGGAGTMAVTFQGKTYYVCCSGCRDEFNERPAKYVAEFEAKKAKKK